MHFLFWCTFLLFVSVAHRLTQSPILAIPFPFLYIPPFLPMLRDSPAKFIHTMRL